MAKMKDWTSEIETILAEPYQWVFVPEKEGGYSCWIREWPGCLSQGETLVEAQTNLVDAAHGWLASCLDRGLVIPPAYLLDPSHAAQPDRHEWKRIQESKNLAAQAADEAVRTFQDQIRERLIRDYKLDSDSIDGAGSDSGDLDFTMAEIGQAISQVDEWARAEGYEAGLEKAAQHLDATQLPDVICDQYIGVLASEIRALKPAAKEPGA